MKFLEEILFRRPRLLNLLHSLHLVRATSQTKESELRLLERHARGARVALEIGSYQGVSASRIAAAMDDEGILYCVDPWPPSKAGTNSCYSIFERNIERARLGERIRAIRVVSSQAAQLIPGDLDFVFIDGDHSWQAVQTDWEIAREKVRPGGIVCLHDALIPDEEPWRQPDSVRFFNEIIRSDPNFVFVEQVYSLAVVRKLSPLPQLN